MDSKLDDSYIMDSVPRGRCIIINNVIFEDNLIMPARIGSTLDAVSLSDLFEFLTFTVELKRDVTKAELDGLVFNLQNEDYSQDSAFAFIILSYGDEDGSFYCTDGAKICATDFFESFIASKCPSLATKPKLFFVLTHALVQEFVDKSKDSTDDGCCDTSMEATVSPDVEDSLCVLGITSSYSATSLSLKSSYINQIVCAVRGYAHTNDITTVLKNITDQITKQEDHDKTKLKVVSHLQKRLFFFLEKSEHTSLLKESSSGGMAPCSQKGLVYPHSASHYSLPFSEEKLSKLPSKCLSMIELGESPHMAVKREMSLNVGSTSSQQLQQFRYKFTKSISEPCEALKDSVNMMSNIDEGSSIPEEMNENSQLVLATMKQEISLGDITISSQSKRNVVSSSLSDLDQEPSIPYHMNSDHGSHGYCIIINNNISNEIIQFEEIRSVLGKEMGLHVEVYTKITRKGIHQLMSSLSSVDHADLDCLIVIIFSEGKKEHCIYGADGKKLQVKEIIAHFSRDSCKSLSNKPKIFLFETQVKEIDLLQTSVEDIEMRDVYIQSAIFNEEEIQTTFLQEFVQTVHMIDDCVVFTDIVDMTRNILHQSNDTVLFKHVDNLRKPLQFSKSISQNFTQECHQAGQNLKMALQLWLPMRKSTIAIIEKKRDKIIHVCRDARRSRVAGAVTSIVGGGLAIVGVGLIPVTFGASLIVSSVGAAVGVAGGVTSVGATLANTIISKANLKGAQAIIEVDQQLCEQVNQLEEQLEKAVKSLHKQNPNMSKEEIAVALMQGGQVFRLGVIAAKGGVAGVQVARVGGTAAIQGGILAAKVTGAAVRGVSIAGGVVSVLILPLDIYELASNAYRLHKKSESNAVQWFNEQIEQLGSQHTEVKSLLQGLQNDNRSKNTTSQESQELIQDICGTTL